MRTRSTTDGARSSYQPLWAAAVRLPGRHTTSIGLSYVSCSGTTHPLSKVGAFVYAVADSRAPQHHAPVLVICRGCNLRLAAGRTEWRSSAACRVRSACALFLQRATVGISRVGARTRHLGRHLSRQPNRRRGATGASDCVRCSAVQRASRAATLWLPGPRPSLPGSCRSTPHCTHRSGTGHSRIRVQPHTVPRHPVPTHRPGPA